MTNFIFSRINGRYCIYLLLAVLLMLSVNYNCAFAAEKATAPSSGMNNFSKDLITMLKSFSESFQKGAQNLFLGLAVIAIVWSFGQLAIKGSELNTFFFEMLKVTLTIGFFWWLITDFSDVLGTLFRKFGDWGIEVANLKKSGPADIVNAGTKVALKLMNPEGSAFNLTSFFAAFIGVIFGIFIVVFSIFMAMNLIIYEVEFLFFTYVGVFVLGTAGSSWTRDSSIAYIKKIIAYSVQYFSCLVLLGLCLGIVEKYADNISSYLEEGEFGDLVLAELNILAIFLITSKVSQAIPQALAGLFGGGSSSGYDAGGIAGKVAGGIAGAGAAALGAGLGAGLGTAARNIGGALAKGTGMALKPWGELLVGGEKNAAKVGGAMSAVGKAVKATSDFMGVSAGKNAMTKVGNGMIKKAFGSKD